VSILLRNGAIADATDIAIMSTNGVKNSVLVQRVKYAILIITLNAYHYYLKVIKCNPG